MVSTAPLRDVPLLPAELALEKRADGSMIARNGQALTVHEPDRDLGTLPIGTHDVRFRITNASSQNLRVIGAAET